ncbi:MAG: NACHT domain-containing protein [Chloroflexi bacterium]|nr:MAG: NACHT domain-containing protein [Chloroflexota bacterium]
MDIIKTAPRWLPCCVVKTHGLIVTKRSPPLLMMDNLFEVRRTFRSASHLKTIMDEKEKAQLKSKLAQIQQEIEAIKERLSDLLPPEGLENMLQPLQQQAAHIQNQLEGSGVLVSGDHNVVLGDSATYITNSTILQISEQFWKQFPRSPTPDPQPPLPDLHKVTTHYLTYLINRYRFLDFRGLGIADRVPLRLPLLEMYVPLSARPFLPKGETWDRDPAVADDDVTSAQLHEPLPVLDLLQSQEGLILLGDPGSGKTTFLKYLALLLATGQGTAVGMENRLPLVLPLSAYANALAESDISLQDFIEIYYRNLGIDLPLDEMLREALAQGGVLLLLDGLDEVKSLGQRHLLVDRVMTFFAFQRSRGNKMVLTSRLVGYRDVRPVLDGIAEGTLVDFDEAAIRSFVTRWTLAVEKAAQGVTGQATLDAEREKEELLTAVFQTPGIRQLATNPLLLTILALMKRQNVGLPQRRVELYDQYIKTLIKHWNLARGLDRPPQRDLDVVETTRVLAPLALWMQETNPSLGLVKETAMQQQLVAIFTQRESEDPQHDAQQFLQDARDYAGLLLDQGAGMYGFLHRTFQEYFTAVAIVQKGQRTIEPMIAALVANLGDEAWYEILRLSLAVLGIVQGRDEAASDVIEQLLTDEAVESGTAVLLAGDALVDLWPGGVLAACRKHVLAALNQTMVNDKQVAPVQRVGAGVILARMGVLDDAVTTVNAMPFCFVPGGPFWLGEGSYEQQCDLLSAGYWIGKFPITNAQFAEFVADGGYTQAELWTEAATVERWENGRIQDWSSRGWRTAPHDYGDPFNLANHPVVGITWYEALACTRWLTRRWQEQGWLTTGFHVALPSEIEWEKAARGGLTIPDKPLVKAITELSGNVLPDVGLRANVEEKRPYPWGSDLPENRANFIDVELSTSSSVGCFPNGRTPYGCEEVSGNVWEWTRSHFQTYPYMLADGRENSNVKLFHQMTLRGGAFWTDAERIRCVTRIRRAPNDRNDNYGFRVVIKKKGE